MSTSKFFVFALFVGLLGATVQSIDSLLMGSGLFPQGAAGFSWVAFLAWATYFFSGCTLKGGIKAWLCFAIGIVVGISIFTLGGVFGGLGFFSFPAAIVIVVTACMFLEKVPPVDSIAAIFVGCGTFFGIMTYVPEASYPYAAAVILGYGALGLFFGWITILFRQWWEGLSASAQD